MARKAPAFQFYVDDFFAGTAHMSPTEVGIYMRLLCQQFAKGLLPSCLSKLARLALVSDDLFLTCWPSVGEKFVEFEGGLVNVRLQQVVTEQEERSKIRAEAGSKGGSKRQANAKQTSSKGSSKIKAKGVGDGAGDGVGDGTGIGVDPVTEFGAPPKGRNGRNGLQEPSGFPEWYAAYPRKVARAAAAKVYERAVMAFCVREVVDRSTAVQMLLDVTKEFAKSDAGNAGEFVPHPATWINAARYFDDQGTWRRNPNDRGKQPLAHTGPGQRFRETSDI